MYLWGIVEGSGKIIGTYSNMGTYKGPNSFSSHTYSEKKDRETRYRIGEILKGEVIKMISSKIAMVALPGGTVSAEIHNRLEVGDDLFFVVDSIIPNLVLKVYSVYSRIEGKRVPTKEIVRVLDFPNLSVYSDTVDVVTQYKNEIVRTDVINYIQQYQEFYSEGKFQDMEIFVEASIVLDSEDLHESKLNSIYNFFNFPRFFENQYKRFKNTVLESRNKKFDLQRLLLGINIHTNHEIGLQGTLLLPEDKDFIDMVESIQILNISYAYGKLYYVLLPIIDSKNLYMAKLVLMDKSEIIPDNKTQNFSEFMRKFFALYNKLYDSDFRSNNNITTIKKYALELKSHLLREQVILQYFIIPSIEQGDINLLDINLGYQRNNFSVVI